MIDFIDVKDRLVDGVDLFFPPTMICGPIFNELFENGMSFRAFEEHFKTEAVRSEQLKHPEWKAFNKYVLAKDIWGNAVELLIGTGHSKFDAVASVVCRDQKEFTPLSRYCELNPRFSLIATQPNTNQYSYRIARTSIYDPRKIELVVSKDSSEQCSVTLLLIL